MPGQRPPELDNFATQARIAGSLIASNAALLGNPSADLKAIRCLIDPSQDIVSRTVSEAATSAILVYHQGLVDVPALAPAAMKYIREGNLVDLPDTRSVSTPEAAVRAILMGNAILLLSGSPNAAVLPFPNNLKPDKPETERVIRGPHQAFTNQLMTNLALLRSLVQSNRVRVEFFPLSPASESKVALCYLAGKAPPSVREEILDRLSHVDGEAFVDVTTLKPALADDSWSPFVNVQLTERVDVAALAILHGRYAILSTGSQEVLLAPATFIDMMDSPEDSYLPRFLADTSRVLRWGSLFLSLLLESVYIAIAQIHQELLPTPFAFAIARSRAGVPMTVFAEVLVMALIIEVLREAAVRLPSALSQTISIVGALVIGQAVVQASLISAPVIVLVAIVALASFTVPQYEVALIVRFLRFPAMVAAGSLGLYGVTTYVLLLLLHLAKLRSFGVSYLAPLAPLHVAEMPRIIRWPLRPHRPLT